MSKTSSMMNQQQKTFNNNNNNDNVKSSVPPNDRFNALTTKFSNNNNSTNKDKTNKLPRNSFVKKLPTATSTPLRTTSATSSNNNSTTATKDNNNNKHGLTSMQRFWLEHIVIDRKIIPLSKLRPTVGVLPWADSGAPKKFNKWCKNILQEGGHCRFGDTCFNAHPGDGYTIEQLNEESHDISVLDKGTHHPQNSNHKDNNKTMTKTVATISDNSTVDDRFASLVINKKQQQVSSSAPQEHNNSVSRSHTVLSHDDVFDGNNDNEEQQRKQQQEEEDDYSASFSRTASPQLTFDTAMLGTSATNNNNDNSSSTTKTDSSSNKQQKQKEDEQENQEEEHEENYISVWRQRGNYAVKYPISHFNEKSLANHRLGKTVVECYFQQGCKDPTCTFLHMKPELIVRVNDENNNNKNNTEKSKKSSTTTSKSSSSENNKHQSSDLVQLLEMIKLQDNTNNNNTLKLIRG